MTYFYTIICFGLIIWVTWLFKYQINPYFQRKNDRLQIKKLPDGEQYILIVRMLNKLYLGLRTKIISIKDRKRLAIQDDSFVYGEIAFLSFIMLLDKTQPQPGDCFYDLGCGAAKAVITSALLFDLSKAVGIERLPGLCLLATEQVKKAKSLVNVYLKAHTDVYLRRLSCIQIINDDFLNCDFHQANILFINATCLNQTTWTKIVAKLVGLQPGSRIIVTTKTIQQDDFQILYQGKALMSWGMNTVTIYKKIVTPHVLETITLP